jgi:hypothetical protein
MTSQRLKPSGLEHFIWFQTLEASYTHYQKKVQLLKLLTILIDGLKKEYDKKLMNLIVRIMAE